MLLAPLLALLALPVFAALLERKPADPFFEKFQPVQAPRPDGLVLKKNDRLAICGDSITEQKMYSRIMETYLTVCVPELGVTARQYGWGGETASGFLARMTNDCLRFGPTIATTCYGMNDHGYRAYEEAIGNKYREKSALIVQAFTQHRVRVIQGSPGCVSKKAEALNLNLCELRNIGITVAQKYRTGFADVFWPMLTAGFEGQKQFGTNFFIGGNDGVHPGWAGQLVMAYAFLKSFGLDGDVGRITVEMDNMLARGTPGHSLKNRRYSEFTFESRRYPFCAAMDTNKIDTIRAGMALVPFNQDLNRLMLEVRNMKAKNYTVKWDGYARVFSAERLAKGINLAEEFDVNPFSQAFAKVDAAVAAKQAYETKQVKQIFHELIKGKFNTEEDIKDEEIKQLFALKTADGKLDGEKIIAETEKKRTQLADAIKAAFVPVTHVIAVTPFKD